MQVEFFFYHNNLSNSIFEPMLNKTKTNNVKNKKNIYILIHAQKNIHE